MPIVGQKSARICEQARRELEALVELLSRRFDVQAIYLFGSLARDAMHELSDVDLLVVGRVQGTRRDRVESVLNLAGELGFSFPLEPHIYTPEEFDRVRDRPFIERVLSEGTRLYPRA